jgi:hypothetical protein
MIDDLIIDCAMGSRVHRYIDRFIDALIASSMRSGLAEARHYVPILRYRDASMVQSMIH